MIKLLQHGLISFQLIIFYLIQRTKCPFFLKISYWNGSILVYFFYSYRDLSFIDFFLWKFTQLNAQIPNSNGTKINWNRREKNALKAPVAISLVEAAVDFLFVCSFFIEFSTQSGQWKDVTMDTNIQAEFSIWQVCAKHFEDLDTIIGNDVLILLVRGGILFNSPDTFDSSMSQSKPLWRFDH